MLLLKILLLLRYSGTDKQSHQVLYIQLRLIQTQTLEKGGGGRMYRMNLGDRRHALP